MNERTILERVHELVEEERSLREGAPGADTRERLAKIGEDLDQCWDLLRQRRAKRQFVDDPDQAQPRDTDTVEGYTG